MPDRLLKFWTLDFIICLPANGLFSAIMLYGSKVTKLVRLMPSLAGNEELTTPSIARLFLTHVIYFYRVSHFVLHDHDPRFTNAFW